MEVIPYGRQKIESEDIRSVIDVLNSDFLTQGPVVKKFEDHFSSFIGEHVYSVAVSNGTAALHLSLLALGLQKDGRVLVTSNSFVATANAVAYCGGVVEFVDIDENTFCINPNLVREKINSKPKGYYIGIITVDFAGHPSDLESLRQVADEHQLWIVEDACHALGAGGKDSLGKDFKCGDGRFADCSAFSFHPVKHITTGEGGMITTRNYELYKKLLTLRSHGIVREQSLFVCECKEQWYYEMQMLGYNYRISDILCAVGLSQLTRVEKNLSERKKIAKVYYENLNPKHIRLPITAAGFNHSYHLYVIQTNRRNELYSYLRENNIHAQVHYIPIHLQPYYRKNYGNLYLKQTEQYYEQTLSIPMYHTLSEDKQAYVIEKINSFFK